jgi:hypothetical protein
MYICRMPRLSFNFVVVVVEPSFKFSYQRYVLYLVTDVLYLVTDVLYLVTNVLYLVTDVLYLVTDDFVSSYRRFGV